MQQHGAVLAAALITLFVQFLNSHPRFPTWLGKGALLGIGLVWYAGNNGLPHSDVPTFQAWFAVVADYLEKAIAAALALPGLASMAALHKQFKTDSRPSVG